MYYLAQANYSQWKPDVTAAEVDEFYALVEPVHRAAHKSKGFVWRYMDDPNASFIEQLFGIERIIFNMTVWESLDDLMAFSFKNIHSDVMQQSSNWFERPGGPSSVLWWIEEDQRPTAIDARNRFKSLAANGPTLDTFTFSKLFDKPS